MFGVTLHIRATSRTVTKSSIPSPPFRAFLRRFVIEYTAIHYVNKYEKVTLYWGVFMSLQNDLELFLESIESLYEPRFFWIVAQNGYAFSNCSPEGKVQKDERFLYARDFIGTRGSSPLTEETEDGKLLFDVIAGIDSTKESELLHFFDRFGPFQKETQGLSLFKLSNIRKEIFDIKKIVRVWDMTIKADDAARKELAQLRYRLEINPPYLGVAFQDVPKGVEVEFSDAIKPQEVAPECIIPMARYAVMDFVSKKMQEHPATLFAFLNKFDKPVPHLKPQSLIGAIWFQVFEYITGAKGEGGQSPIKFCPVCETHGRYSPDTWIEGKNGEYEGKYFHEHCYNNLKSRLYRKRKAKIRYCLNCGVELATGQRGAPRKRCPACAKKRSNQNKKYPPKAK